MFNFKGQHSPLYCMFPYLKKMIIYMLRPSHGMDNREKNPL